MGRRRIRNSIDHWLSSIPSLIFLTTPSEPSSFAPSRAPKLVCAARKIAVAPMVAAVMLKSAPGKVAKRNPPVSVAMVAPGSEKATISA
jgi:ApbE superfamily uncharacterized protein (UPF0280 family)